MQFAKGKIKVIGNRIKIGERLESKDYGGEHLKEFLRTMDEERKHDIELASVLKGESDKVRNDLNILRYMLRKDAIALGLTTAAGGAGVVYGGALFYTDPAASLEDVSAKIIMLIIATSLGLMFSFSKSTFMAEEDLRKGEIAKPFLKRVLR